MTRNVEVKLKRIEAMVRDRIDSEMISEPANPAHRHRHGRHDLSTHNKKKDYAFTRNKQWDRLEKVEGIITDKNIVDLALKLEIAWEKWPTLSHLRRVVEEGKDPMASQMSHRNFLELLGPWQNLHDIMHKEKGNPFHLTKEECGNDYPNCGIVLYESRKLLYLEAGIDMISALRETPIEVQCVVAAAADRNMSLDAAQGWILQNADDASLSLDEDALVVAPAEHARQLQSKRIELQDTTEIGPAGPRSVPGNYSSPKHRMAIVSFGSEVMVLVFRTGYERQAFVMGVKRLKDPSVY